MQNMVLQQLLSVIALVGLVLAQYSGPGPTRPDSGNMIVCRLPAVPCMRLTFDIHVLQVCVCT